MAGLIFDKAQIEQTIDAVVARTMRMDMTWDWPCGVAYYGICEAYEVTGKQEYLKLVQDRVDEYIELGLPEWTVNTCSMGHCLITLYEHTGDERYLNIAKSKVDYLENKARSYAFLRGTAIGRYMVETVRGYLLGLMMETGRSALWTQGGADTLADLTFTNFMIKTCRITDLLLKKEYQRAIASVEASLALDTRLISAAARNFMYCGLALCYLATGRLGKAAEWLNRSLTIAEQDKNYSFIACFRKYFQALFLMPSIAARHGEAIREIKALAIHYTRADESRIFAMLDDVPELKEALTDREREVAQLAAGGMRNSEIAETLHISENTVKHHLKNAFQKMNIDRRSRLIEMLR